MRSSVPVVLASSLIAPWLLLVAAWKTKSRRQKHWLLTLFVTIYGSTITIAYDPYGAGPDGVRHLLSVYTHYTDLGFGQFLDELWSIILLRSDATASGGSVDVYKHVLAYLTGSVLATPQLFFPIAAFVYGYFFTGSLLEIFRHFKTSRWTYLFIAFAFLFFLIKNIEGVNTVRTWTGLWILVYACLKYYSTKKKRYAFLMFVPPFIHFGYFIMAIPAWLVLLCGNREFAYAILFVASSFTTIINPGTVTEVASETELGQHRVQAYYVENPRTRQEVLEAGQATGLRVWKLSQQLGLQKWALNVFIYTLLLAGVYFRSMSRLQKTIFSIGLLTVTLSNMTWYLYAVTNRSWLIGCVFILAAYLMTRQDPITSRRLPYQNKVYKAGLHISLLLFLPYFVYNLSTILDYPSVFMLGFPLAPILSPELNMSIKEGLKALIGVI